MISTVPNHSSRAASMELTSTSLSDFSFLLTGDYVEATTLTLHKDLLMLIIRLHSCVPPAVGSLDPPPPLQISKNTAANTRHVLLRCDASIRNALSSHPSSIYYESGLVLIRFKGFFSPQLLCLLRCGLIAYLFECLFYATLGSMCYITASLFPSGLYLFYKEMSCESLLQLCIITVVSLNYFPAVAVPPCLT